MNYTGDSTADGFQCLEVKWDFNSPLQIEDQVPGLYGITVIPDVINYTDNKTADFKVKILRPLAKDDFS